MTSCGDLEELKLGQRETGIWQKVGKGQWNGQVQNCICWTSVLRLDRV